MEKLTTSNSSTTPIITHPLESQDPLDMATLEALIASFKSNSSVTNGQSENNPSYTLSQAQQLASLLSSGPAITSEDTGKLLVPVTTLCAPSQSPIIRSAGYTVITALCGTNGARSEHSRGKFKSDIVLTTIERRRIWEALCAGGSEWFPETSVSRLDALQALLDIGPRNGDAEGEYNDAVNAENASINIEGLDGLLTEISAWMSSAVDSILSAHEESRQHPHGTPIYPERNPQEDFIERLDAILSIVTKSDAMLFHEQDLSKLLELYSSWVNQAVRDEFRALHAHAALSVSIVSQQQVRAPRFHGRAPSTSTTPTTFTFPSSIVTPAEATIGVSRAAPTNYINAGHVYQVNGGGSSIGENSSTPPYMILGPLFLNLVERWLKQNVLIPTDTLPRVIKTACYLLALTMKPITAPTGGNAYWDNSAEYQSAVPMRAREYSVPGGVRSSASSSIRQPRSSASASQSQEASTNVSPRVSQRRAVAVSARDDNAEVPSLALEGPMQPIDQRAMTLLESLLHDNWYAASSLQIISHLLLPSPSMKSGNIGISPSTLTVKPPISSPNTPLIAHGAVRAVRFSVLNALMSELAREHLNDWVANSFTMGGAPALYGHMDQQQLLDFAWRKVAGAAGGGLGVRFEKLGAGLSECVKAWRDTHDDAPGGPREEILMECCALVTDVLGLSPKGEVGEVPRFAGELLQELALIVRDYRSGDGSSHRLRLASVASAPTAPTLLLTSVTDVLRLPLAETNIKPSLASILISLSDHLNDTDAVTVIQHLEKTSELSPSFPDWAETFRTLIDAFCTNARTYPKARRLVALELQKVYSDITDIDGQNLRAEIVESMLDMWEKTLHEEPNEEILNAAFDIMSSEIVLATMANVESGGEAESMHEKKVDWTSVAERIRRIWMKVAVAAPPYYENDKIASLSPTYTGGMPSPSALATPNIEASQQRILHSPVPSLPVNSINSGLSASSNTIYEQPANNIQANSPEQPQQGPSVQQASPLSTPKQGRAVFAAIFLIKAFNKLAFRSPQSLTILLSDAGRRQSASAARMAIALFRNIVQLVGTDADTRGKKSSAGSIRSENVSEERLQCPKARLVILQWLLRLRADRDHRIYGVGELESEVLPLARMVYRAEQIKSVNQVSQDERPDRDLPSGLAARRRNRAETRGAGDIRMHRNLERDRENTSREHTREPRGRGRGDPLSANASRSRSRPPASPQTPYNAPRPREVLWSLPETLAIELEKHATRPSPAMATFTSIRGEEGSFWLHVDYYVQTLASLLEHERDWEIVSYILCHLPLQLANKHFFCGPKSAIQIRKLVLVICNAINEDKLSTSMDALLPPELLQVDIQALLYHTLMVLISYHRLFDPQVGEYDQNAKSIKLSIVEVIVSGLARDEVTSRPCLEALSLAVYELTDQVTKFTDRIIEKLSRIMSNPHMAVHILELLIIIGYTPKLYSGSFREEDYQRVFAVAILYIEHHYRPDAKTLKTNDGRDSYALAQHVLNTAFFVIYIWFLAIKLEDRARYVTFIVNRLIVANDKREVFEPTTEVCFDWIARYAYSNADPKPAPSFLYRSIVAPGIGAFNVNRSWEEQHKIEQDNTTGIKAWKLGNSLVTISTMKKPPGWVRIVSRRPSGLTEMICRLENWPHVSPGDFAPDLVSMPVTMLADRPVNYEVDESLDVDEDMLQSLINDIVEQSDVIQDIQKPDPISGYVWSGVAPSQRRKEITIDPAYIALLLSSYPSGMMTRPSRFLDYASLKETLMAIDYTPVIDTHKVGVVYVAPGQRTEAEIFANQHGSPAYTRFLANLGRVIKPSSQLEVYTGGLRQETHGVYAYSWWDDMSQIVYHVATAMPNINKGLFKKQEIGNDGVKIVWNDSGAPFKFDTILSEYTLVNVVVEPHSVGARGAYSDNRHENEFFKVTLQTAQSLPRITPIGEFKIISAEKLSMALRHFTLQASLFCKAWENTGMDGLKPFPLQTNWQARLKYIKNSESKLPPKPSKDLQQLNGTAHREGSRDFTLSY